MPSAVIGLHLHHWLRFITDAFEVIIEPSIQLNSPVHTAHVWIGFLSISSVKFAVSVWLIGIIVGPLARDGASVNSSINQQLIGWESVVWIDVPILHSPNNVDTPTVVFQYVREVPSFVPVVVPFSPAEFGPTPCRKRIKRTDCVV